VDDLTALLLLKDGLCPGSGLLWCHIFPSRAATIDPDAVDNPDLMLQPQIAISPLYQLSPCAPVAIGARAYLKVSMSTLTDDFLQV
jgi:hypothetical protein